MRSAQGEIYDIGYQRYDGPREGRNRARLALWTNGVRQVLGLGRGWTSKALPVLLMVALLAPALVFVLVASATGGAAETPGHAGYYQIAAILLFLFAAISAPELLCADRRSGVINLYLVRPLSPTDYVLGRWLAFFTVTLGYAYVPQLLLFVGLTLGAEDAARHLRDTWTAVPRFLAAGLAVAATTTTIPLAVSAFTTRRAIASAVVVGLWLTTIALSGALLETLNGPSARWASLIAVGQTPVYINGMIFGSSGDDDMVAAALRLPRAAVIAYYLALLAAPAALTWWRYQRLAR